MEVKSTVWVNDDPAQIEIARGGIPAPANKYQGYKLDDANPEYPSAGTKVDSGSVYTVNYVKDDTQTKDLWATIDHNVGGIPQTADSSRLEATVWILAENTLSTTGVAPLTKYTGYKFDHVKINGQRVETLPSLVKDKDEIVFYYVKNTLLQRFLPYAILPLSC